MKLNKIKERRKDKKVFWETLTYYLSLYFQARVLRFLVCIIALSNARLTQSNIFFISLAEGELNGHGMAGSNVSPVRVCSNRTRSSDRDEFKTGSPTLGSGVSGGDTAEETAGLMTSQYTFALDVYTKIKGTGHSYTVTKVTKVSQN